MARKQSKSRPTALLPWTLLLAMLLLLLLPPGANSFACVDPSDPDGSVLVRGRNTTVCLYVGPGGDWNSEEESVAYRRFSTRFVADEFSSYHVPNSFQSIMSNPFNSNATHVFAASQNALSFLRRFYDVTTQQIFPYLTAIIDVRDGIVQGIAWDDACIFCAKSRCTENTYNFAGALADQIRQPTRGCYLTTDECMALHAGNGTDCDLKLFVVWTGTGEGGESLLSSDSRFSAFPPDRIQENVKNGIDDTLNKIPDLQDLENIKDDVTESITDGVTDAVGLGQEE